MARIAPGVRPWELPYPYAIATLDSPDRWNELFEAYRSSVGPPLSGVDRPLYRCLEVARAGEAHTAVIETRYIDADYRSEFSAFYSKAFLDHETSVHRIHFFKEELAEADMDVLKPEHGYLGFITIRPTARGVVGRSVLRPPPELRTAVRTGVRQPVHLFGQDLEVRGVPFMQQDARLGSCAHAAAWMCHYSAYLARRGVSRRLIAEFSSHIDASLKPGRHLPTTGLSLEQVSHVLSVFGLPPRFQQVDKLADEDRPDAWPPKRSPAVAEHEDAAKRAICRYLNSGLPVLGIVKQWQDTARLSDKHAVVACGYLRHPERPSETVIVINDDRRGPYLQVAGLLGDRDEASHENFEWQHLLTPMPEKLWLSGEAAERNGCAALLAAARVSERAGRGNGAALTQCHTEGNLTVRTYAIESNRFKRRARERFSDAAIRRAYSVARFSRFIWVVEAIDRNVRDAHRVGQDWREVPCVMGEVIFDATSDEQDPHMLALRIPGLLSMPNPDDPNWDTSCSEELVTTGGQYDA